MKPGQSPKEVALVLKLPQAHILAFAAATSALRLAACWAGERKVWTGHSALHSSWAIAIAPEGLPLGKAG